MAFLNIDSLATALEKTHVAPSGVSFAGKSLKLDSKDDAEEVVKKIDNCDNLEFLNLEGNTLGVEASKEIAKALEKHPEFKLALWKDMFTGRMKDEIPKSLQYLGNGLVASGAKLTELDLSDNAFGPIGVEGLASLLRSSSCFALEILRLNNNGLGITGGKLLACALTDCYNCSKKQGKPLSLKVFIAGRNRLENDGSKAIASVFTMIGTLEEIAMPQNGIYHPGISALSDAFMVNKNLKILNLNDNTIGPKGAEKIAKAIIHNQNLKEINFGDCLLKSKGTFLLAEALKTAHLNLEELNLGFNEIKKDAGLELVNAMANKVNLKKLVLDGNHFGEEGKKLIEAKLKEIGKFSVLESMDENESEDESEEENDDKDPGSEEEDSEEELNESKTKDESFVESIASPLKLQFTAKEFLETPSASNFLALGHNRIDLILKEAKKEDEICVEDYIKVVMKVSSLSNNLSSEVSAPALDCAEKLYKELFSWAQKSDKLSFVNNTILINLGLIKCEDKKFKPTWNLDGCLIVLKNVVNKNYVPDSTKDTIKMFMKREVELGNDTPFLLIKKDILSILS